MKLHVLVTLFTVCVGLTCLGTELLSGVEVDFCPPGGKPEMEYGCVMDRDIAVCTINSTEFDMKKEIQSENITALYVCLDFPSNLRSEYRLPLATLQHLRILHVKSCDQSVRTWILHYDCHNDCRLNLEQIRINVPLVNRYQSDMFIMLFHKQVFNTPYTRNSLNSNNIFDLLKQTSNIMVLDLSFTFCTDITSVLEFIKHNIRKFSNLKELLLQKADSTECKDHSFTGMTVHNKRKKIDIIPLLRHYPFSKLEVLDLTEINMANTRLLGKRLLKWLFRNGRLDLGQTSIRKLLVSNNKEMFSIFNVMVSNPQQKLNVIGLEQLQVLNVSGNSLRFEISKVCHRRQSFANSLTHFYGSDNEFQLDDAYMPCLTCAKKLKHLDLSRNNLRTFPEFSFTSCSSLEYISLGGNKIDFSEIFLNLSDAHNLAELDISHNSIHILSKQFRNHLDELVFMKGRNNKTLTISFEGNPLNCSCHTDVLSFNTWMQTTTIKFKNSEKYTCYGQDGLRVMTQINLDEYKSRCFPSPVFTIVTTMSASFSIMLIFGLIFIIYYKRFTVLYYIFQCHQMLTSIKCSKSKEQTQHTFKYDVFVSYCAKDRFWVHDVLMAKLEKEYNFKLCIHYRDFPAGGSISDVIVEKLNQSQEIIFVMSDNFIEVLGHSKRPWFQFELDEACDLARLRKKNIIVIRLGKITRQVNDRNLASLLDEGHIFLQWPENVKGQKVFWAKLSSDLYGDAKNSFLGCCFNTRSSIGPRNVEHFSEDPFEGPGTELYAYKVDDTIEEVDEEDVTEI